MTPEREPDGLSVKIGPLTIFRRPRDFILVDGPHGGAYIALTEDKWQELAALAQTIAAQNAVVALAREYLAWLQFDRSLLIEVQPGNPLIPLADALADLDALA